LKRAAPPSSFAPLAKRARAMTSSSLPAAPFQLPESFFAVRDALDLVDLPALAHPAGTSAALGAADHLSLADGMDVPKQEAGSGAGLVGPQGASAALHVLVKQEQPPPPPMAPPPRLTPQQLLPLVLPPLPQPLQPGEVLWRSTECSPHSLGHLEVPYKFHLQDAQFKEAAAALLSVMKVRWWGAHHAQHARG